MFRRTGLHRQNKCTSVTISQMFNKSFHIRMLNKLFFNYYMYNQVILTVIKKVLNRLSIFIYKEQKGIK